MKRFARKEGTFKEIKKFVRSKKKFVSNIACHLSKIYHQSERKTCFFFAQNYRFFISKTFGFFIQKKEVFLENTCSRIFNVLLLLVTFLKFISSQKEKRGFIWPKTFEFLFLNIRIFIDFQF